MKKQGILIGILVVLIGVAVYVWSTQEGEQVDPKLAETKLSYNCPHCNQAFQLTMEEEVNMVHEHRGVICPHCGKNINDVEQARTDYGGFDEPVQENQEPAPKPRSGLRKVPR